MIHQPPAFCDLSFVEAISPAGERIITLSKFEAYGRPHESKFSAKIVGKETFVRLWYRIDPIPMDHDRRRIFAAEMCESKFDSTSADEWGLVCGKGRFEQD